jgi:hypothetical protein
MFNALLQESAAASIPVVVPPATKPAARLSYPSNQRAGSEVPSGSMATLTTIDQILENEKQQNKAEAWNKLDKTVKMQKLHAYADKYGRDHGYSAKGTHDLKVFFSGCLERNKLQKTKEVIYDKERGEITAIPALALNATTGAFTLKVLDKQRVSTLKALTPLRKPVLVLETDDKID